MQQTAKTRTAYVTPLTWTNHVQRWRDCTDCPLCQQRDNIVLARGTIPCDVLLVGEAPGESENLIGQPFVGPAGHLLDGILDRAWKQANVAQLTRAFSNLVCCYPREAKDAGINEPSADEIEACRPRLEDFILLCKPRLVVAVGKLADEYLPGVDFFAKIFPVPGKCAIIHPAAILRMPAVQQGFATQKAIVTLTNALEEITHA